MRIPVVDFTHWRAAARSLLTRGVPPADVQWLDAADAPRHRPHVPPAPPHAGHTVPRRFLDLTATAALADDADRWDLFYTLAWRLTHGEPDLLDRDDDPDVRRLEALAAEVDPRPRPDRPTSAARCVPVAADAATLLRAMRRCDACRRCEEGEPVPGGGPLGAGLLIVAEAPGAAAQAAGRPLDGDAGATLARALARAGVDPRAARVTYAIKHPSRPGETRADRRTIAGLCRPWLMAELALDPPAVIVALGDIAARGVLGRGGRYDAPAEAHDGPGGVPVFVAPALDRVRLAEAADLFGPWHALVDALAAADRRRAADDAGTAPAAPGGRLVLRQPS